MKASELDRALHDTVESVVNWVGADLNTASKSLLQHISGLNTSRAGKIVKHRETHGPFKSRDELLKVSGIGPKTFLQCAGFLRGKRLGRMSGYAEMGF